MPLNDVLEKGDIGRHKKLGTIRLGWQEPNANGRSEHPVASDHFVMTDAQYLTQFFGEEPTQLPIFFPFDTFDKNIEAYHRLWAGGKRKGSGICICQGNGDMVLSALPFKATRDKDPDGNDRVRVSRAPGDRRVSYGKAAIDFAWDEHKFSAGDTVPCPGGDHDLYTHCAACNPSIVLKVMIRDVRAARFGYWQISTRSLANYKHFVSVWDSITDGGKIPIPMNQAPFILSIAPGNTLYQDKNKNWASREAFYLQLELDPIVAQIEQDARSRRFVAMLQGRVDPMMVPQLVAAGDECLLVPEEDLEPPSWMEADFEDVEDAPEPEPHKWTKAEAQDIFSWTREELTLSDKEVLGVLGVSRLSDYPGTPDEARAAINKYVGEKAGGGS